MHVTQRLGVGLEKFISHYTHPVLPPGNETRPCILMSLADSTERTPDEESDAQPSCARAEKPRINNIPGT